VGVDGRTLSPSVADSYRDQTVPTINRGERDATAQYGASLRWTPWYLISGEPAVTGGELSPSALDTFLSTVKVVSGEKKRSERTSREETPQYTVATVPTLEKETGHAHSYCPVRVQRLAYQFVP
jgi:hypothetical protein